jgi:hypothetical protein
VLLIGVADLTQRAHAASFRFASDNRNPYAYAHPVQKVVQMADWLNRLATIHPDGYRMVVKVVATNPWPLPWYLRRFERVGYWERPPDALDAPVVIVDNVFSPVVDDRLQDEYKVTYYRLRPGTVLAVHVTQSLWVAFAAGGDAEP